jgi:beta-xylosidase
MPSTPLFPFGHGLSYTIFQYGPLQVDSDTVDVGGEIRASLTVTNSGDTSGTEIVQLYAADTATGVTLPAQQLIGFARVDLEPGESKTVGDARHQRRRARVPLDHEGRRLATRRTNLPGI